MRLPDRVTGLFLVGLGAAAAYGGWQAVVYFSEEVHEPERNVARATFGGIALITAIYTLINAAVLHVLPMGFVRIRHYGLLANAHPLFRGGDVTRSSMSDLSNALPRFRTL